MPITLPEGLPAAATLRSEGIAVDHAGGGRSLHVVLVNLMPDRPTTETQFARMLAAGRHRVQMSLALPEGMVPRDDDGGHTARHYRPWSAIEAEGADAVIVTGAPVERLPFAAVRYWPGIVRILEWQRAGAVPAWYVCWAAQAALWHGHGIPKHELSEKAFGVYPHGLAVDSPVLAGLGPALLTPVSRHTRTDAADLRGRPALRVLASRPDCGLCLADEPGAAAHYMLNHPEYDADTLHREYLRDLASDRPVRMPDGYFPRGDPSAEPVAYWRPQAVRLFQNWLETVAGRAYGEPEKKSCIVRSMNATSWGRRKDAAM